MKETPEFLYQMIQNYLKMEPLDPKIMEEQERKIRLDAEKRVKSEIDKRFGSFYKKLIFRWVLRNARQGVRNRENMRFARTRIYGVLRELLNAIGNCLKKEQIIDEGHDIYYLTINEVEDYIKGTAVTTNLKGLIMLRKEEFAKYKAEDAPKIADHFETYGMAYHHNLFQKHQSSFEETQEGGLKGIGCSPGKITAKVKIVNSPRDNLELSGEILVANRTDPGWIPLYPTVSGILIERGSILSHSVIVAREMGIPVIVGIPNLLHILKDGQTVTMNGTTGEITVSLCYGHHLKTPPHTISIHNSIQ